MFLFFVDVMTLFIVLVIFVYYLVPLIRAVRGIIKVRTRVVHKKTMPSKEVKNYEAGNLMCDMMSD